jgi:phosphatidylglycerophosphate synthase
MRMAAPLSRPPIHIRGFLQVLAITPDLISASRFVLGYYWTVAFFAEPPQTVGLRAIALAGAASDFIDGRIARWTNSASGIGQWLDSSADIMFILAALSCEAYIGVIPIYLPALIATSFGQYVADSIWIRGSAVPVKSRLGHWAGIFNYVMVIALSWAPPPLLPAAIIHATAPIVALFYVAAICERALYYRSFGKLLSIVRLCGLRAVGAERNCLEDSGRRRKMRARLS